MAAGQHRPAANPLILRGSVRVGRFARLRGHRAYEEVLPTIRKTGGYMMSRPGETPAEVMARAVLMAQHTLARKDAVIAREREGRLHERAGRLHAEARVEARRRRRRSPPWWRRTPS